MEEYSVRIPSPPSEEDKKKHKVFVYGSMLTDEIAEEVIKRVPISSPAILHNYHRYNVKDRLYPAVVPMETHQVVGKVLFDLTDLELNLLDLFEDYEYERLPAEVTISDSMEKITVDVYVWVNKTDPKLHGEWNFQEWKEKHFKDFLQMTIDCGDM
ncbi:Protein AIG2 [Zostera marina]|uniref:Putative gamma-glutamylcyclotransferase n=1 Tax=Zostera marina TaxID=29655 RepID=A0A0K9NXX6_ZOSMR|nr:Protein AIG2 [Zostera marina]